MTADCNGVLEHLVEYLEGDLEEAERRELEEHFSGCNPCMRFLETYQSTGPICKKALEREMPAEMKQSLLVYLRTETKSSS